MDSTSTEECRSIVYHFSVKLNEWERDRTILDRIAEGKDVSDTKRQQVAGITLESHLREHAKIFSDYVVPRTRKYGSNPGLPNSWGRDGRFTEVSREAIREIRFPAPMRAEVIADWGIVFPGGQTMFVLKRIQNQWRIDSLKLKSGSDWGVAYL